MYEDKTISCRDCGADFVFTSGEQEFYAEKGFNNEPTRCKPCRARRKTDGGGGGGGGRPRSSGEGRAPRRSYSAVCAECGSVTELPFEPTQGRPVYCRDCFQTRRR